MKLVAWASGFAALALVGCASMDDDLARSTPQADVMININADDAYVAKVERIARRRGIEVIWVNPPLAREADAVAAR